MVKNITTGGANFVGRMNTIPFLLYVSATASNILDRMLSPYYSVVSHRNTIKD